MIGLVALAGYLAALIAIYRHKDSERRVSRIDFAWYAIPYLTPWIFGITSDLLKLNGLASTSGTENLYWSTEIFIVYISLFAYPLFRQMMGRLNDCGGGTAIAYISLIPLINIFTVIYLLIKPTATSADLVETE